MSGSVPSVEMARQEQKKQPPNVCTPLLQKRRMSACMGDIQVLDEHGGMPFKRRFSIPLYPVVRNVRDHCHYEWVAVLMFIVTLMLLFFFVFIYNTPPAPKHCATPLGQFIGVSNGVAAFSNCNRNYLNVEQHFVLVKTSRVYSGVKWRALEYAQRFWLLTKHPGVQFVSVRTPEEVWTKIEEVSAVNGARVRLLKYASEPLVSYTLKKSTTTSVAEWMNSMPRNGDLLVYASDKSLPEGHIAVIVGVERLSNEKYSTNFSLKHYVLYLAEQNWDNQLWVDVGPTDRGSNGGNNSGKPLMRHYSRTVTLLKRRSTLTMSVYDPNANVLGWVRAQDG